MSRLLAFSPHPELEQGPAVYLAIDHVRTAVVDFMVAIQQAQTPEELKAIRKQIEARELELRAVAGHALDRELELEAAEDRAVDRIIADLQRLNKE